MTFRACALGAACGLCVSVSAVAQPDFATSTEPAARYDGHRVVRVSIPGVREMRTALALTEDVWSERVMPGGSMDMRMTLEQLGALAASGLRYTVMIQDVQALIDAEIAQVQAARQMDDPGWYTTYHTYDEIRAYVQTLAAAYPELASYVNLGNSIQGRELFALKVTGPGSQAGRPAAVFNGCQHAREWITPPTVVYIGEQLLTRYASDAHTRFIVDNSVTYLIPIVNPDGYVYTWTNNRLWRKNRRTPPNGSTCFGVDTNRNWGYQWGGEGASTNPCNDTYRGASAMSEPEVQRLRDFAIARPEIRVHLDFHSYSQLVMSPWGYTGTLPPDAAFFQSMDEQMAAAILGVHGKVYEPGPIYTTIYPASGTSVDWFYGARGIKSFTIEERDTGQFGFLLPADQITPTAEENFAAIMVLLDWMTPCYANCDGSTASPVVNVLDFNCFLNRFAAGDSYANCDGSTVSPVLNILDFNCFLNKFAAGCP
jgi:carboxypeptidase A4